MRVLRLRDPWTIAAVICLFAGAILLVVAWYDISGTATVYEQLPYLVSAGFSGLALIIVGSALVSAGRTDRVERRLAQLVDAITEAAGPPRPDVPADVNTGPIGSQSLLAVPDGTIYHRDGCLLLRGKSAEPVTTEEIAKRGLTPCPVCEPGSAER